MSTEATETTGETEAEGPKSPPPGPGRAGGGYQSPS